MAEPTERVQVWHAVGVLGGVDLLRADFRRLSFAPHFHDDYTFGLITRGANRFRYERDQVVAPQGSLCLATPGAVHTGEATEEGWSYWTVHVPVATLAGLALDLDDRRDAPPDFARGVIEDPGAARLFAAFFRSAGDDAASALEREVRAVEALGRLIRGHAVHRPAAPAAEAGVTVAAHVRDLLAARAAETVTLADLEAETGVGRFRLIRAFRAAYGMPPHAWQVQVRLSRARALIRTGLSIADAAAEAGFADQAHLTRLFKRSYGFTPGRFARSLIPPAPLPATLPPRRS